MNRTIILSDYNKRPTTFEIKDFEHVICIVFYLLSGDECMSVIYDDRDNKWLDSCDYRTNSFFDDTYVVYVRNEFDNMDEWIM